MNPINQWLSLVKKARTALNQEAYKEWHLIIGASGSLEERIELGREALKMLWLEAGTSSLTPSRREVKFVNAVNAVSPTFGDYPMQRGVIKA